MTAKPLPKPVLKYLNEVEQAIGRAIELPNSCVGDFTDIIRAMDHHQDANCWQSARFWFLRDILVAITRHNYHESGPERVDLATCVDFTPKLQEHYTLLHYAAVHYFAYGPHRLLSDNWLKGFILQEDIQLHRVIANMRYRDVADYLKGQIQPTYLSLEATNRLQNYLNQQDSNLQPVQRRSLGRFWRRRKSP